MLLLKTKTVLELNKPLNPVVDAGANRNQNEAMGVQSERIKGGN